MDEWSAGFDRNEDAEKEDNLITTEAHDFGFGLKVLLAMLPNIHQFGLDSLRKTFELIQNIKIYNKFERSKKYYLRTCDSY